jgi:hypothetical protein
MYTRSYVYLQILEKISVNITFAVIINEAQWQTLGLLEYNHLRQLYVVFSDRLLLTTSLLQILKGVDNVYKTID